MKYTDGKNTVEAFKWNGNVLAGTEKGTPQWLNDAVLITHKVWFDAAWNMKVETAEGMRICNVDDYIVRSNDGSLNIIAHDEFKAKYRKA